MTRLHFETIANTIVIRYDSTTSPEGKVAISNLAHDLAKDFARINPRFDMGRFLKACGVYGK